MKNKCIITTLIAGGLIFLCGCDQAKDNKNTNITYPASIQGYSAGISAVRENDGTLTYYFKPGLEIKDAQGITSVINGFDQCPDSQNKRCIKVNKKISSVNIFIKERSAWNGSGDKPNEKLNVKWKSLDGKTDAVMITRQNGDPLTSWYGVFPVDTQNAPLSSGGKK
ncbi:TPA: hypothetical protein ACIVGF_002894 [Salmonella enterica subsp. enterica serovar 16:l,v:-]|nr:hypothetical protein [Salmonella enterica]